MLSQQQEELENATYSLQPTQEGTNTRMQAKQDAAFAKTGALQEGLANKQEGWEAQERGIKNRDERVVGAEDTERKAEGAAAIAKNQLGGAGGAGAAALEGAEAAENARQQNAAQDIINARQRKDEYHDREKRSGQAVTQTRLGAVGTSQDRLTQQQAYSDYLQRNRQANAIQDEGAQQAEEDMAQGEQTNEPDNTTPASATEQPTPPPQQQATQQNQQKIADIVEAIQDAGKENIKGVSTADYWRAQAGPLIKAVSKLASQGLLDDAAKNQIRQAFQSAFPTGYNNGNKDTPDAKNQVEAALNGTGSDIRIKQNIQSVVSDADLKCIVAGLTARRF